MSESMNDQPSLQTADTPKKRTRKPATKTLRVRKPVDPRILAEKRKCSEAIANIRREDASARQLRVIKEKRLPNMTPAHRQELFDHLAQSHTPMLPGVDLPADHPHGHTSTGPEEG